MLFCNRLIERVVCLLVLASKRLLSCVFDFSNWSQRVTKRCIAS